MPITIHTTQEQQAEVDAHWAKVRAGLHVPLSHDYRDDAGKLVDMHRALAWSCLEGAARHMRMASTIAAHFPA